MPRRCQSAFTLIELILVIMIVAMMAGLMVPAYDRFYARIRFDGVGGEVMDLFAWARDTAITSGTNVTIHYDPVTYAFTAVSDPSSPPQEMPEEMMRDASATMGQPIAPKRLELGEDYRVSHIHVDGQSSAGRRSDGTMIFRADGTSDGGDFLLTSRDGYQSHFILRPAVGTLILAQDEAPQSP